ncbi:hypothetical protein Dsin_008801 [Dipteronia sinensis]|uniref:Endonuclease/exonuclease/phosphatase domain-containing protein n=1 Tax=Dipteronia sinensis TaxID=43782 RepID=A0AAE0APD6_9ROSI|nr:hypothetical protein Dsin_008801 [Dipteronia sinensis]
MKIFAWNVRGLGSSRTFNILRTYMQDVKPEIVFLIETKCTSAKMERWRVKLGFCSKIVVDSIGRSGGLCLFWNDNVTVNLVTFSQGHIDVNVSVVGGIT